MVAATVLPAPSKQRRSQQLQQLRRPLWQPPVPSRAVSVVAVAVEVAVMVAATANAAKAVVTVVTRLQAAAKAVVVAIVLNAVNAAVEVVAASAVKSPKKAAARSSTPLAWTSAAPNLKAEAKRVVRTATTVEAKAEATVAVVRATSAPQALTKPSRAMQHRSNKASWTPCLSPKVPHQVRTVRTARPAKAAADVAVVVVAATAMSRLVKRPLVN